MTSEALKALAERVEGATGIEYIVIVQSAWMNQTGFGIHYGWDGERFATLKKARKHGFEIRDSDDFNIGHVIGDHLIWFGWMDERIAEDDATMLEIAEACRLKFDRALLAKGE